MQFFYKTSIYLCLIPLYFSNCKKLITIPPPVGSITTSQVFSSDNQAQSAMTGIYYNMINNQNFSRYGMSIFGGMSADELLIFNKTQTPYVQFQENDLTSSNAIVSGNFWANPFSALYGANSVIEGLSTSAGVHDSVKNELIGEAEFVRAFSNFYLVYLFGDIPLITTINWHKTNLLSRTSVSEISQTIISDLKDAQSRLPSDYSVGLSQRIIPNKWAATALLARAYLYQQQWDSAQIEASLIINHSGLYRLTTGLDSVFLINSNEAIWQLQQDNVGGSTYNATPEGGQLIPVALNSHYPPFVYITNSLLTAFEPGDQRRIEWVDSTKYTGSQYYFPYKYKMGKGSASAGGAYTEYYMVLRLAEQYLIRAEAETKLGDLSDAAADLNIIRNRAGLPNTTANIQADMLTAIAHERQVELFCEWGQRWLDLKRTGQATTILSLNKGFTVNSNALLFPIPISELIVDPNLTQNEGY